MKKIYTKLIYDNEIDSYISDILYFPFGIIKFFLNYNSLPRYIDNWLLDLDNISGETPTIFVEQIDKNTIQMYDIFEALDYEENKTAPEPDVVTLTPTNFIYLLKTWKEILQEKPPVCYLTYDEETNWINLTANPDDIKGFQDSNAHDIH